MLALRGSINRSETVWRPHVVGIHTIILATGDILVLCCLVSYVSMAIKGGDHQIRGFNTKVE
jgi:hypothetical protein